MTIHYSKLKGLLRLEAIFTVAMLLSSCAVETQIPSIADVKEVSKVSNATVNSLIYSLPVTVVRVEIEAEKTVSKVGPFYRYSQKYLNISDVVLENKEEWKLKGVKLYTVGEPDNNNRFLVTSSGPNIASFLNLTQEGILTGVNLNEPPEYRSSLKCNVEKKTPGIDDVSFDAVPLLEKQLTKTSTAAMAEETANLIYKVRKRRFKILASDYEVLPPDGKSYEVTVKELNKYEKQLVELFTGKKETFTVTKTFDFIPDSMSVDNAVLCRFSSSKGLLDPMDLSGTPVYIQLSIDKQKSLPSGYVATDSKEPLRQGLFYRIPVKASVKIIDRNILMLQKDVLLGQYGQLVSLPVELLQKDNVRIELDPATGALKNISKE